MSPELVLAAVFRELLERGVPLGTRDYLEGLRALRLGFGGTQRNALCTLCERLWARNAEEERIVRRLFAEFAEPSAAEVADALGRAPEQPIGRELPELAKEEPSSAQSGRTAGDVPVEFVALDQTGIEIPRANWRALPSERFILEDSPPVSPRALATIWRRFRKPQRAGARVEPDVDATVAEKCRRGYVADLVRLPARVNQARLVVLIDVSESMLPWQTFNPTLVASLEGGRLGECAVYYFQNVPRAQLFCELGLQRSIAVRQALDRHANAAALVFSDGGCARGRYVAERVERTRQFLQTVRTRWQPLTWVNPMPRARWAGTSAAAIDALPTVTMTTLDFDGLVQAVDVMRGLR